MSRPTGQRSPNSADPGRTRLELAEDARAIADAIKEDERLAAEARGAEPRRLVLHRDTAALMPEETVYATRDHVLVRQTGVRSSDVFGGTLYLTDIRVLVSGPVRRLELPIDSIEEIGVVGSQLLQFTLGAGSGVEIQAPRPRLLRVEIQALRRRRAGIRD